MLVRGIDLLDFWRCDMSIRRLSLLVSQLVRDPKSALLQAIAPIETMWTPAEHILAAIFDATTAAHFKDPAPYPRPGDAEREASRAASRRLALEAQAERMKRAANG